jgi:hypothetical protein
VSASRLDSVSGWWLCCHRHDQQLKGLDLNIIDSNYRPDKFLLQQDVIVDQAKVTDFPLKPQLLSLIHAACCDSRSSQATVGVSNASNAPFG